MVLPESSICCCYLLLIASFIIIIIHILVQSIEPSCQPTKLITDETAIDATIFACHLSAIHSSINLTTQPSPQPLSSTDNSEIVVDIFFHLITIISFTFFLPIDRYFWKFPLIGRGNNYGARGKASATEVNNTIITVIITIYYFFCCNCYCCCCFCF